MKISRWSWESKFRLFRAVFYITLLVIIFKLTSNVGLLVAAFGFSIIEAYLNQGKK